MKNLKNTAAAFGLMVVLAVGSASANTGILMSDKSGSASPCGTVKGGFLTQLSGILIVGLPMLDGILMSDRAGILMSDRSGILMSDKSGCGSKGGILVSDRDGILVSDRSGILVSD